MRRVKSWWRACHVELGNPYVTHSGRESICPTCYGKGKVLTEDGERIVKCPNCGSKAARNGRD